MDGPSGWTSAPPERFTIPQLRKLAENAGFRGNDADTMAAISYAESGGRRSAVNPSDSGGSYGLTQINEGAHGPAAEGALKPQRAFDDAYALYRKRGNFDDWSTYKSGEYHRYMERGRDAPSGPPGWSAAPPKTQGPPGWTAQKPEQAKPAETPPQSGPIDPEIAARTKQIPAETWAEMAKNPQHPMWKRVGAAIVEEGKRMGQGAYGAFSVFGDVASGKASMSDPATQQRVMDAAGLFGMRGAPGELGKPSTAARTAGESAVEDALKGHVEAEQPSNVSQGLNARRAGERAVEDALAPEAAGKSAGTQPPGASPAPRAAGAAATPVHEILADNVRRMEERAGAEPGFKDHMRSAANLFRSFTKPENIVDAGGERTAGEAAASIRRQSGRYTRISEQAKASMDAYVKSMNGLSPEEGLQVIKWLQTPEHVMSDMPGIPGTKVKSPNRYGLYQPTEKTKDFMDAFRGLMQKTKERLKSLPKTAEMEFKEDFVSQLWKDPKATLAGLHGLSPKQGSNYFAKKSVFESYEDGIRNGFVPITTNPLEIAMRYVENANKYMSMNEVLDEGAEHGNIVWRERGKEPQGWVELGGRASSYKGDINQRAYAPPGYATVFNNYVSIPFKDWPAAGDFLRRWQRASNLSTMWKLSLSAFHAGLMYNESMASGLANAIDSLAGGRFLRAMVKTAETPIYPLTSLARARQVMRAYLDPSVGGPKTQKIIRSLVDANFRVVGKGNIADEYRATFLPTLWESWRKGRLRMEANAAMQNVRAHPVSGTAQEIVSVALRGLESASAPIFQYVVPRLKVGAAYDMMATFLKKNPNASDEELAAYAREVSDTIDNRFGEMNHDNIFWHRTQKQMAQAALLSYSYTWGTLRALGGAATDVVKAPGKAIAGKNPWTSRMSYPIALGMVTALSGSIYQYLKTGQGPKEKEDLFYPKTGGVDPKSGMPQRAYPPGQIYSMANLFRDPSGEFGSKISSFNQFIWNVLTNTQWPNDAIINWDDPAYKWIGQVGEYAMDQLGSPMIFSQKRAPNSALAGPERFFGMRDAPRRAIDPKGSEAAQRYYRAKGRVEKKLRDENKRVPPQVKKNMIRRDMSRYGGVQ